MLKPISRLRFICKGDLNHNTNSINKQSRQNGYYSCSITRVSKRILHSIPVLSIFVILGIIAYSTIVIGFGEVDGEVYAADSTSNTSSLIIDNGTATDSTATVRNGVAYSSHTVQVSANNINGYSLKITGPTNLTGSTTITGAGNKTPANMANNTWGYAWGSTSTANTSLSYNSFTGNAQTLSGDSVSNNSINFTRKLVFAAKFDQNAAEGHYKANVKLNLAVTPKALTGDLSVTYNLNGGTNGPQNMSLATNDPTFTGYSYTIPDTIPTRANHYFYGWTYTGGSTVAYYPGDSIILTPTNPNITLTAVWGITAFGVVNMQDMTPIICKIASVGDRTTLYDARGSQPYVSYTIQKLQDGHCWMVDNLKLDLKNVSLTSTNSDVANYPAGRATERTSVSSWSSTDSSAQFIKDPSAGSGTSYQPEYGYYYSWCAATAGTCSGVTSNSNASSSICPLGWKLPRSGKTIATNTASSQTGNDFANLAGLSSINSVSWSSNIFPGPPAYFTLGGANWYRAGVISVSGFYSPGSTASYWSRTASSSDSAYALYLNSSNNTLSPADDNYRYSGRSIRCIAYSS